MHFGCKAIECAKLLDKAAIVSHLKAVAEGWPGCTPQPEQAQHTLDRMNRAFPWLELPETVAGLERLKALRSTYAHRGEWQKAGAVDSAMAALRRTA